MMTVVLSLMLSGLNSVIGMFLSISGSSAAVVRADGTVYLNIDVVNIELYTDKKDPELEKKLQELLTAAGLVYEKNEVWIPEEKLYEVLYEFEMEA